MPLRDLANEWLGDILAYDSDDITGVALQHNSAYCFIHPEVAPEGQLSRGVGGG